MENVITFKTDSSARVDSDKIGALYRQLGEAAAEDVVCRAVEELAIRLAKCEALWRDEKVAEVRKALRGIAAIADQIGLQTLANVANATNGALHRRDHTAASATFARLIRVGEKSLTAVWDLQDLSV